MKTWLLIVALSGLLLALPSLGYWSWRESTFKEIQAPFAVGFLSPIRAKYPSFVTQEQEAEIQRLEQELQDRLVAEARSWKVLSITFYAASVIPLSGVVFVIRWAMRRRRVT